MTSINMTTEQLIATALRGEPTPVPVAIYLDRQDPANEGPAYRIADESGELEFTGWSEEADAEGYDLWAYFDGDGRYLGPDSAGIYPVLIAR